MGGPPSNLGQFRNKGPIVQDMPPNGGYPQITIKNMNKARGPGGIAMFAGFALMTAYGFYMVGYTNKLRRRIKEEKRNMRIAIAPMLQFEQDVKFLKDRESDLKKEAEVMKDVPGWKVGEPIYKTNAKWMPPIARIKWDQ